MRDRRVTTLKVQRLLVKKNNPAIHHGGKVPRTTRRGSVYACQPKSAHRFTLPTRLIASASVQETKRPMTKKPSHAERKRCATERESARGERQRDRVTKRQRHRKPEEQRHRDRGRDRTEETDARPQTEPTEQRCRRRTSHPSEHPRAESTGAAWKHRLLTMVAPGCGGSSTPRGWALRSSSSTRRSSSSTRSGTRGDRALRQLVRLVAHAWALRPGGHGRANCVSRPLPSPPPRLCIGCANRRRLWSTITVTYVALRSPTGSVP